ncbi:MAG: VWA domain-containing protein [Proteobacteria bacterium]|nr:VWA domain-containing protein [Pseudomonadota bacterium]
MNHIRNHLALCAILLTLSGCDTVAELTFQDEQLIEAIPQGLISKQCGALDPDSTDAIFRFSILTSFDARLTPGKRYAALTSVLRPGKNFNAEDVVFSDGWFFVVGPDGQDMTCTAAEDCPTGASCLTADEMGLSQYYYAPERFCAYSTMISVVSTPRFTHFHRNKSMSSSASVINQNYDGRTIAFVLDNSSTLDGSNENGTPNRETASDPWEYRKVGLNQFMDGLAITDESTPRLELSAHFANGTGTTGIYDASSTWMRTTSAWEATVMSQYPTPSGNSPIWEASTASLLKIINSANPSYSKIMIAMTDGEPNGYTDDAYESFRKALTTMPQMPLHWLELTTGKTERRYADIVSMGCGTHYIFDNPVFFSKILRNIAINTESWWDVDLHFSAVLPTDYTYRLATTMVAKVGSSAVSFEAQRMTEQNETIDYRLVLSR